MTAPISYLYLTEIALAGRQPPPGDRNASAMLIAAHPGDHSLHRLLTIHAVYCPVQEAQLLLGDRATRKHAKDC